MMTEEKAKTLPGTLLTDATAVHPRWYRPSPPAFLEQQRALEEEQDTWRRLEEARRIDEWEQTPAARTRKWRLFSPNWSFLAGHDAFSLRSLVALSVGLHPYFANEAWVFNVAMPYFKGEREHGVDIPFEEDDAAVCSYSVKQLDEFIKRLSVAVSGLNCGILPLAAVGKAGPVVACAEFFHYAAVKGWHLPEEFTWQRGATTSASANKPALSEPLQDAGQPDAQDSASVSTEVLSAPAVKPAALPQSSAKGIQRRVLVMKYRNSWPTIETDLKDAATNGLSAAAKAGSRGWREADARAWAKANGRLLETPEPGTLGAVMKHGFTGQQHKLGR